MPLGPSFIGRASRGPRVGVRAPACAGPVGLLTLDAADDALVPIAPFHQAIDVREHAREASKDVRERNRQMRTMVLDASRIHCGREQADASQIHVSIPIDTVVCASGSRVARAPGTCEGRRGT